MLYSGDLLRNRYRVYLVLLPNTATIKITRRSAGGSASHLGCEGRRFEPCRLDKEKHKVRQPIGEVVRSSIGLNFTRLAFRVESSTCYFLKNSPSLEPFHYGDLLYERDVCIVTCGGGMLLLLPYGPLAQLVEHLFCKQEVAGSIPARSTTRPSFFFQK